MSLRELTVLLAVLALPAGCVGSAVSPSAVSQRPVASPPGPLAVRLGASTVHIAAVRRRAWSTMSPARLASVLAHWATREASGESGPGWRATVRWDTHAQVTLARAVRSRAGSVRIPVSVVSAHIDRPRIRQALRNNCETAALAMMLGGRVGQLQLQRELPLARPLDPIMTATGTVWGDPEQGFVGHVEGGGYGVYDRPLLALARRYQPTAENLTGTSLATLRTALAGGRPVVAWIQFGPSSPRAWRTPAGRPVAANFAEHAILLVGFDGERFEYHNPWEGTDEWISWWDLRSIWHTLGDRAIAGASVV